MRALDVVGRERGNFGVNVGRPAVTNRNSNALFQDYFGQNLFFAQVVCSGVDGVKRCQDGARLSLRTLGRFPLHRRHGCMHGKSLQTVNGEVRHASPLRELALPATRQR